MRPRVLSALLALTVISSTTAVVVDPAVALAGGPSLVVTGSPFDPNGDGKRETLRIEVVTAVPATVDLVVRDFDGRTVRKLARAQQVDGKRVWTWNGRDREGRRVPPGPYRVKAVIDPAGGAAVTRQRWVTRARRVPYPERPGAVLVALDAGHGGPADGAVSKRLREDAVNLDIALRLGAMLKGAGIGVIMTRRTDRNVSPVGLDLNFDGKYTRLDELIARNDVGNRARAGLHIALHNNANPCGCTRGTEMYTHDKRGWSPEGRRLAKFVLEEHIRHLSRVPGYTPRKRGVKYHDFKALRPFHKRLMPRPSLQPSILGESLFIDWPSERRLLSKRSGRTTIAAGYFDGIARYLAWRPFGLRYDVLEAPRRAPVGSTASVRVRLTNTGNRTIAGWKLVARVVTNRARYDGQPKRGSIDAKAPIPDALRPGQSTTVTLPGIPLPEKVGPWLLKLDVIKATDSLSKHGVVGPQLRVDTTAP